MMKMMMMMLMDDDDDVFQEETVSHHWRSQGARHSLGERRLKSTAWSPTARLAHSEDAG